MSELDSELNAVQTGNNSKVTKERSKMAKNNVSKLHDTESEENDIDFACVPASNLNKDTMTFVKLSEVSNLKDGKGEHYDS